MRSAFLLLLTALTLQADVVLNPLFTDHGVLQRDQPLPIWGTADAGELVSVSVGGQQGQATASADGRWIVVLEPLPGSTEPVELLVEGKNKVRVTDLLIGDVWLCSGQSNMEWGVRGAANPEREMAAATNPLIRHIKIPRSVAERPATGAKAAWEVCSPATVGDFSAVGYFFARDLQPRLNVPIGLVNSSFSGTEIECWISPATLTRETVGASVLERWTQLQAARLAKNAEYEAALAAWNKEQAEARQKGTKFSQPRPSQPFVPGPKFPPSSLFNGMIHPLLPAALRGVLWYQGESNWYNPAEYAELFPAMIRGWREHFGQPELPFYWVQLANYKGGNPLATDLARVREAQARALSLAHTAQAVAIDIGDRNDIHPKNKQEVGRRLALIARAELFGAPLDSSGPVFASATREDSVMRVRFSHAEGLTARNRPLQAFQLAGADRVFHSATARIEGDSVIVNAPQVPEPVAVRYAFFNAPDANLYNGAGLPAAPFRSDDW